MSEQQQQQQRQKNEKKKNPFAWNGLLVQNKESENAMASSSEELPLKDESAGMPKVGVTILTGFLGSGKTTLLNRLLSDRTHGKRIAVIQNEFAAEIGVESELVQLPESGPNKKPQFAAAAEVGGGCACCGGAGEFQDKLSMMLFSQRKHFDHIIVECTGLIKPSFVATFFTDEFISERVFVDGIVAVVDSKHVSLHLDGGSHAPKKQHFVNEAREQIAAADRIILNKTDLLGGGGGGGGGGGDDDDARAAMAVDAVAAQVKTINPAATVFRTTYSNVPSSAILEVGAGHADCPPAHEGGVGLHPKLVEEVGDESAHLHILRSKKLMTEVDQLQGIDGGPPHDPTVSSVVIATPDEVELDQITAWLEARIGCHDHDHDHDHDSHGGDHGAAAGGREGLPQIFRGKGVIAVKGRDEKFIFQSVHDKMQVVPHPTLKWLSNERGSEPRVTRVVFIGRDLPKYALEHSFRRALGVETARAEEAPVSSTGADVLNSQGVYVACN